MLLLHVKQNTTKLGKNYHPHNTESWIWLRFIWKTIGVMRRAKSMYVYDVKTQKPQVRGTPRKCCSRSQQRSSPALQLRLTPLLVLIERVWWISHSLITSSALDIYYKAHFTHLWYKKLHARAIFVKRYSRPTLPNGVLQQLFGCLLQSLPDITY